MRVLIGIRGSLKSKFVLITLAILLIWFVAMVLLTNHWTARYWERHYTEMAREIDESIISNIEESMLLKNAGMIPALLTKVRRERSLRDLRIFNVKGEEVFSEKEGHPEPDVKMVLATGEPIHLQREINGTPVFLSIYPIKNKPPCHECHGREESLRGAALISLSMESMVHHISSQRRSNVVLFIVMAAFIGIVMIASVRYLFIRPIEAIQEGTEFIKKGNFNYRIPVNSEDEIGKLSITFNSMTEALQALFDEHKRVETELKESEQRYRGLVETSTDAIISIDEYGEIVQWNEAATRIFGFDKDEAIGSNIDIIVPERYGQRHREGIRRFLLTEERRIIGTTIELEGKRKDGTAVPVDLSLSARKKADSYIFTGILRDISERKRLERELVKLASTDTLTGAYNRMKFESIIEAEIERHRRYGKPLSVIMFDIDHFKRINDGYGHNTGDQVLKSVAGIVGKNIRKIDYLFRWGGEEFLVVAFGADMGSAKVLAERLRKGIENCKFEGIGTVTASFGLTEFIEGDTRDILISRADAALYRAKSLGRNRVETSS